MPRGVHGKKNRDPVSVKEFFGLWGDAGLSNSYLSEKYAGVREKYGGISDADVQSMGVLHDVLLMKYADEVLSGRRTGFMRGEKCCEKLDREYANVSQGGCFHDYQVFVNGNNGTDAHEIDFVSRVDYDGEEYLMITEFKRTKQGFDRAVKQLGARRELGTYWGFLGKGTKGVFFVAAYPSGKRRKIKRPEDLIGFVEVPIHYLDASRIKEYRLISDSEPQPGTGIIFNLPA
jgi:hypothetical protein